MIMKFFKKSLCALSVISIAWAADITSMTLGDVAVNIQSTFPDLIELVIAVAYVSGIGFGLAAIFKFKQVKDNPTQIPLSTPFALLGTSAMLVFLPSMFAPAGVTMFGDNAVAGSPSGSTVINNLT